MTIATHHRLHGLEPDNLLAFLALLGLLRALETDEVLRPRAYWDLEAPPLRPTVVLARALSRDELVAAIERSVDAAARAHDFGGRNGLDHSRAESRALLEAELTSTTASQRQRIDVLAALMSDGAVKDKDKEQVVDPTPLCLLFGQGHQHFLERFADVPRQPAPPPAGKNAPVPSAQACLADALFEPWQRKDPTSSFRWDPAEDVRYALMAGDPTDKDYKIGTQHGANRLAAIGLAVLTVVPEVRGTRVRAAIPGGAASRDGFSFSWPIWRDAASLAAIRALLAHPELREVGKLAHLGVDHVMTARRISVGKFMNFTRARVVAAL